MTQKCNLGCTYCGNEPNPALMPVNLDYSLTSLKNYFAKEQELPVIAFYGGEPLMFKKKVMEIMDTIEAKAFMIQTNGTLLHTLPQEYLRKFHSILVSTDGDELLTDCFRGKGVYKRSLNGAQYAIENGFEGDLVARMTATTETDIFKAVTHLLSIKKNGETTNLFNHVHWQLDALWDNDSSNSIDKFERWMLNSYNPGITKLVEHWIDNLRKGVILGIAPFLGITFSLLMKEKSGLRCGAGKDFFSITTDGRITFCPIPPSFDLAVVGNIANSNPAQISNKVALGEPCTSCNILDICGGRCLYTNKTQFWGKDGFNLVCETVRHLIKELKMILPEINQMIVDEKYVLKDFKYPVIENGVEVIP